MQRLSELSNFTQLITWRHAWLTKKTHLGKAALTQIIRLCMQLPGHLGSQSTCPCRKLLPVVVFVFSRKRIDQTADNLNSLDLTSASEKAEIHIFVEQSVSRLKGGDRRLPQIIRLKQMLKRGLGVHHAGLSLLQSNSVQFNLIQFNSIQFNSIQFHSIHFNSTQLFRLVHFCVTTPSCRCHNPFYTLAEMCAVMRMQWMLTRCPIVHRVSVFLISAFCMSALLCQDRGQVAV